MTTSPNFHGPGDFPGPRDGLDEGSLAELAQDSREVEVDVALPRPWAAWAFCPINVPDDASALIDGIETYGMQQAVLVEQDEARSRFAAARVGRMATVTPHGTPHVVPVVFALVDEVAYTAVDGKPKTTMALQRLDNIAATGRASLLVDEYREDWSTLWWVRCDGSAQVLDPDSSEVGVAMDALARKYPQYVSDPPPGPVIAVRLAGWRSWEATPTPHDP